MVEGSDSGLTPMLRQYLEIKEQHKDAILFFRLGDFYEMFFDDAVTASKILDIALTSRNRNEPNPVPLCGIPYHAASGYISKLIEKGKKVAICEQVEDPATAKGIVKREVVQVITPGLITELEQMRSKENNYLVCFQKNGPRWGVSFLDLLTGDFKYSELSQEEEVLDLLSFLSPQEILYPESERDGKFLKKLQERFQATLLVPQSNWRFDPLLAERLLKEQFQITSLSVFDAEELPTAKEAAGALLYYVKDNQKLDRLPHLRKLERYEKDSFLWIGQETRRNLELEKTVSGESGRGTLLSVLDQTLTAMGG
ncbi:MAG: DNA mismatch repair protein MutS, partial [bacterium]|nr:DNA mismatch repair protein MutS [bacterium]